MQSKVKDGRNPILDVNPRYIRKPISISNIIFQYKQSKRCGHTIYTDKLLCLPIFE
jgi:hypothetical protein